MKFPKVVLTYDSEIDTNCYRIKCAVCKKIVRYVNIVQVPGGNNEDNGFTKAAYAAATGGWKVSDSRNDESKIVVLNGFCTIKHLYMWAEDHQAEIVIEMAGS